MPQGLYAATQVWGGHCSHAYMTRAARRSSAGGEGRPGGRGGGVECRDQDATPAHLSHQGLRGTAH